jgi:glycosyltransferase involved in cell wall biosynthesis
VKVLHYIPSLNLAKGGPVRAVLDLTAGLAARGHSVTLVSTDPGDVPKDWNGSVPGKPAVVMLPDRPAVVKPFTRRQCAGLRALMPAHDVLHLHGTWDLSNVQASRDARRARLPYVVSLRGMLDDWPMSQKTWKKRLMLAVLVRRHLERALAVHCTAQGELDQSRKWFPRGRGLVIPNMLDLEPFRHAPGPDAARAKWPALRERRNVLFLSRIDVKKGADVFLRAGALLRAKGQDCNLVLAGTGDPRYIQEMQDLARALNLADRALFTGHVNGELKIALYQSADVFALPTSQENFGFVFPEALASGTPVVTTKGVDIWPELEQSGGSLIVERTPDSIARAVAAILDSPARRSNMSRSGQAWVMKAFDESHVLSQFEAMYAKSAR